MTPGKQAAVVAHRLASPRPTADRPPSLSLDTSEGAARSEDYARTDRAQFQKDLVACLAGSLLAGPSAGSLRASTSSSGQNAALVASSGPRGRPVVALHPTTDGRTVQAALDGIAQTGGDEGLPNLAAAVKLALVGAGPDVPHTAVA